MSFEKEQEEKIHKTSLSAASDQTSLQSTNQETELETLKPKWCPEKQIYLNGIIPSSHVELAQVLNPDKSFRIFGYGSLCWNPGKPLSHEGITKSYGKAIGWKRCWCQRSADHRGTVDFLGLVCTLLSDDEYMMIYGKNGVKGKVSMTEGVLYTVPEYVADEVLGELDFREKGGYSRDVIDVIEDETNQTVKALLYRGTPENPAFWKRPLLDLPFAAAIMSVAKGPSGYNDEYLYNLDKFLTNHTSKSNHNKICSGDISTRILSNYCKQLQAKTNCYFLYNCGSNQYNQLLLDKHNTYFYDAINDDGDVMKITESVLVVSKLDVISNPIGIYAGGGHSALLLENGMLYLWGCNDYGQLGRASQEDDRSIPFPITPPLSKDIVVKKASLGFSHTLIIENNTGYVYAFGDNTRGQVSCSKTQKYDTPVIPSMLQGISCIDISASLFHSAVITTDGELILFGSYNIAWKPPDCSKLIQVSCGRKHTIVLDEHGRIWSLGDNKYGQLGRVTTSNKQGQWPGLVDGVLGQKGSGCFHIDSGWSHNIAMVKKSSINDIQLRGWGRNDKGQLGYEPSEDTLENIPKFLSQNMPNNVQNISCGSEYSMLVTKKGTLYSCGWNEHGNLGINTIKEENCFDWKEVIGSKEKIKTYIDNDGSNHNKQSLRQKEKGKYVLFAAGGAHFLSTMC